MTWRSLTCSSLAAVALQAASVSGTVQVRDSRVDAVNKRRDYSGIVVSLRPVGQASPESATSSPPAHAVMRQKNKTFLPHVLPVLAGTVVAFPNFDPIFHNAFSSYSGQIFDVGLYPPGSTRSVRFFRPGVVRVFCNIHSSMSAVILVLDTPYFATTRKDGSFDLDAPAGTYELNLFHERATEQTLQSLTQRVVVASEGLKVPVVTVSEGGYLVAPHKNKYGREYGPPPDDKIVYPRERN